MGRKMGKDNCIVCGRETSNKTICDRCKKKPRKSLKRLTRYYRLSRLAVTTAVTEQGILIGRLEDSKSQFAQLEASTHVLIKVVQDSMAELTFGSYGLEREKDMIEAIANILAFLEKDRKKCQEIPFK